MTHITHLKITDFEGLEALEINPSPTINMIEGRNGAGKTSVLDAIRAACTNRSGRSLLVHEGADEGLILFELSDGTNCERQVTPTGYTAGPLTARRDGQSVVPKFLEGSGFGFNPLAFIGLRADEQTEQLLKLIPINIADSDLLALSSGEPLESVDYTEHPLQVLDAIKAALFEQRRVTGIDARKAEATAEELRAELPDDFDRRATEDFDLTEAVTQMQFARGARNKLFLAQESVDKMMGEIARLQEQIVRQEGVINATQKMVDNTEDPFAIETKISEYKAGQELLALARQADEQEVRGVALRERFSELQDQLAAARDKPGELLANVQLPVPGLGIEDGTVTINGLPISELSTGEQLSVAADIAIATLGDLSVVLVDGLEALDPDNQTLLLGRLANAGVQAFVTKISDGELTIITDYTSDEIEPGLGLVDKIPF